MAKIGISLEASSWRGAFVAGVLESFGRREIYPDLVSGSSSGACNGAAYVARDLDLLTDNWIEVASQPMIDFRPQAREANGGSIFNMSRIYDMALDRGVTPLTIRNLIASPVEFLVVCTRLVNGAAASDYWNDYFLVHYPIARRLARLSGRDFPPPPFEIAVFSNRDPEMKRHAREILYASGRIPILYAVRAKVKGEHYVDGGFIEKNPIRSLFERGCDQVLALVTNPEGTVHESFFSMSEAEYVRSARREGRLLVLQPDRSLGVSKYSWSVPRIKRAVRWGRETGEAFLRTHGDRFFGA